MGAKQLEITRKALELNLDATVYGTIAEIGAGQEVARAFFSAGAASGTVAKTISAYDMKVSDEIYGQVKRYVSRERLISMLDHEYSLIIERLNQSRGERSRFFAFSDTVSARNFKGSNECHGWLGIRYQAKIGDEPSDIILHVRMLDSANTLQQEALGVFGVNLIYGAYNYSTDIERLIASLADGLRTERIEVEVIEFSGPAFEGVDSRSANLSLIDHGLSDAVLINASGNIELPSEVLYKKPVLLLRGSFRPVTNANIDMLESGVKQFSEDADLDGQEPIVILEMTIKNLVAHNITGRKNLLALSDTLSALGYRVLVSDYPEYYRLSSYLRRYTTRPVAILMGPNNLFHVFDDQYYEKLKGGILEALGRLFRQKITIYVHPMAREAFLHSFCARGIDISGVETPSDDAITAENLRVWPTQRLLYRYARESGLVRHIPFLGKELMGIHSSELREQIRNDDSSWEKFVPEKAVEIIKQHGLFKDSG